MAEAFARAYGSDVLVPASAGLAPASSVARDTLRAMDEKGLSLRDHFPKSTRHLGRVQFDIVVDMSGGPLPENLAPDIRTWSVADPISVKYKVHCEIRDEIERLVMGLVIELRRAATEAARPSSPVKP